MERETWGTIDSCRRVSDTRPKDTMSRDAYQRIADAKTGGNEEFKEFMDKPYSKLTAADKRRVRHVPQ